MLFQFSKKIKYSICEHWADTPLIYSECLKTYIIAWALAEMTRIFPTQAFSYTITVASTLKQRWKLSGLGTQDWLLVKDSENLTQNFILCLSKKQDILLLMLCHLEIAVLVFPCILKPYIVLYLKRQLSNRKLLFTSLLCNFCLCIFKKSL